MRTDLWGAPAFGVPKMKSFCLRPGQAKRRHGPQPEGGRQNPLLVLKYYYSDKIGRSGITTYCDENHDFIG